MTREQENRCKELTVACWWPSRAFPRPNGPDWKGIADDLAVLAEQELMYRNDVAAAREANELSALCSAEWDKQLQQAGFGFTLITLTAE